MKRVYTSKDDIIHLFSNNIDHDVRSPNMSVEVHRDISYLYSYSTVISKYDRINDVYLISTRSYSVTTSRQQSMLNWSIIGSKKIYVYDVNDHFNQNLENFKHEILDLLSKHERARQNKIYHEKNILDLVQNMQDLIRYKKVDLRKYGKYLKINTLEDVTLFYEDQVIKDKKIRDKKSREIKKQRLEDQRLFDEEKNKLRSNMDQVEKRLIKINNLLPKLFHNNKNKWYKSLFNEGVKLVRKYNNYDLFFDTKFKKRDFLRLTKNNNVITSQGVTIPYKEVKRFNAFYQARQIMTGDKIDHYSVNDFNQDQEFIRIGCHIIEFKELDYIANQLKKEEV